MSRTFWSVLALWSAVFFGVALAQLSAEQLPPASGLARLLGTDAATVNQGVTGAGGRVASGLKAGDGARGETAREITRLLVGEASEQYEPLYAAFMAEREKFEHFLEQNNFALNDVGVAYGVAFAIFWVYATGQEDALGEEASLEASKFAVYAIKNGKMFDRATQEEKDRAYDWLLATPLAFASLVEAFEGAGRREEAAQLRLQMGEMFRQLFLFPPEVYTISAEGKVGVDAEKLLEFKKSADSPAEVDALIDDILGAGGGGD
jgi:hypothetical protein